MPLKIKIDTANRPEIPTLILSKKNGDKFGTINNISNFHVEDGLNSPPEFTFTVHKNRNDKICTLWNDITDFKLLYVNEWDKYFEIKVKLDIEDETIKNVTAKSMQEEELCNVLLFGVEINTENDISRDDYIPTVLYNSENPSGSLLNRLLSGKAEHYIINHVDASIAKLQRTFQFDNIAIYDAFMKIAEELNCLFIFGESNNASPMKRTISVYDLESNCIDCGYRGEYINVCPKCQSTNVINGYGDDTTILIDKDNLADNIHYYTNTDEVKNCFKLEAGDDLMTSTVVNINPSGSSYIYYIPEDIKKDMSDELVQKLDVYDQKMKYYETEYGAEIESSIITQYNELIEKYQVYRDDLETINTPIVGYQNLTKIEYDAIDFDGYLRYSLMPSIETEQLSAEQQASLLTSLTMSPISLRDTSHISLSTVDSAITSYAKVLINTGYYKVKVKQSSISNNQWTGILTVSSYSDEEDVSDTSIITVVINDDYENFIKQQIDKTLAKSDDTDCSIIGAFKLDEADFADELKKYGYSYLKIFDDACQSCLDILIEQGLSNKDDNLYNEMYMPYYNKKSAIEKELIIREKELAIISGTLDEYGDVKYFGLQNYIEDIKSKILKDMDFQKCLGDCWEEFCSFRRDDLWSNENYISEGLSNKELFNRASEFLDTAKKDIYKSGTSQHVIESTLKNLFAVKSFEMLRKHFEVGNWMRIMVDGTVYVLRLIGYKLDYDNLNLSDVTFSDVVKSIGTISDIKSILDQSKSTFKSYNSVKRQASQGAESKSQIDSLSQKGLDATNIKIFNNADNQDIVYDKHGLLFRKYDTVTKTYSGTQLKIINSTLALTTNNWESTRTAIGEFIYYNPRTKTEETGYGIIANQIVGDIVLSEEVGIYNKSGTMTFNKDGLNITNNVNTFTVNPNSNTLLSVKKNGISILSLDASGDLNIKGNMVASSFTLAENAEMEVGNVPAEDTTGFNLSSSGLLTASNAVIYGSIYAKSGKVGGWNIGENVLYNQNGDYYTGMSTSISSDYAFFAGSNNKFGESALFRVKHDGCIFSSDLTIEKNGFRIKDNSGNTTLSINEHGFASTRGLLVTDNVEGGGNFNVYPSLNNKATVLLNMSNSYFKFELGADKTYISTSNAININTLETTPIDINLNGNIAATNVYSNDYWGESSLVVTSNNNNIKLNWTGSVLEVYVGNTRLGNVSFTN